MCILVVDNSAPWRDGTVDRAGLCGHAFEAADWGEGALKGKPLCAAVATSCVRTPWRRTARPS